MISARGKTVTRSEIRIGRGKPSDNLSVAQFQTVVTLTPRIRAASFARTYSFCGVFVFFIIAIAASEVAVGLAILTRLFKVDDTLSTKEINTLGD